MALSISSNQPSLCQQIQTAFAYGFSVYSRGFDFLTLEVDGATVIAELAASIFALLDLTWKRASPAVNLAMEPVFDFLNFTTFICLFKRLRDWTIPDEKGKMVWEYSWQYIASMVCYTVSQILSAVDYLHSLTIINLNKFYDINGHIYCVAFMLSCALDMWADIQSLEELAVKKAKAICKQAKWEELKIAFGDALKAYKENNVTVKDSHRSHISLSSSKLFFGSVENTWKQFTHKEIQKWEGQLKQLDTNKHFNETHRLQQKLHKWRSLNEYTNIAGLEKFCTDKINQWKVVAENHTTDRKKAWVNLLVNALCIAYYVIGYGISFPASFAIECSILAFTFGCNILDLVHYLLDEFLPTLPVPEVALPKLASSSPKILGSQ